MRSTVKRERLPGNHQSAFFGDTTPVTKPTIEITDIINERLTMMYRNTKAALKNRE